MLSVKKYVDTPLQQLQCSLASQDLILNTRQNGRATNSEERKRQNRQFRNRSVCGYVGVACVAFFFVVVVLKMRWNWSGEGISKYVCKRSQSSSRKGRTKMKIRCNSQFSSWHPELVNVRRINGVLGKKGKRSTESCICYTSNLCFYCPEFPFDMAVVCFPRGKKINKFTFFLNCSSFKL